MIDTNYALGKHHPDAAVSQNIASAAISNEQERSKWQKLAGKLLIISTLVSFIFIGALINVLQVLLLLSSKLSSNEGWKRAHKRANGALLYALFAQPIFVLYAWPRIKLNVVIDDKRLIDDVRKQLFGIILANHTYELDWMACFLMADQLGNIGSYKSLSKDELKYLPLIGWSLWMGDLIFVKRDWKRDRLNIERKLDELLHYDQILLGIFAEGTRWSQEKHDKSVEFARERSLTPFKHHLFPRPRGFNYTLRHYLRSARVDSNLVRVFNLEMVLPDKPKFKDFLDGRQLRIDVFCEEVVISDELRIEALESRDENDCPKLTNLLHEIYRRKDYLLDEYKRHGGFYFALKNKPTSGYYPIKQPVRPFFYWLASMSLTYGTFIYLAVELFACSPTFWSLVVMIVTSGVLLLRRIERESKPTSGNSSTTSGRLLHEHKVGGDDDAEAHK